MEAHGMRGGYGHMMSHRPTAELYVKVVGAVLVVLGIVGFFINSDFSSGNAITADELVLFDINGWSNVLHLLTGLVAIYATTDAGMRRMIATGLGVVYMALAVWSLFDESILGMLPVNDLSAILYAAIGIVGLMIGLGPDRSEHSR